MKTFNGIKNLPSPLGASVVTIGNFDGLHMGHQVLISQLLVLAEKHQCPTVVFTFDPHPLEVLAPDVGHLRIFTKEDLQEQLQEKKIDFLNIEPFSEDFAKTAPEVFFKKFLVEPFTPKALVVGHDFAFGQQRAGDQNLLEQLCIEHGVELRSIDPVETHVVVSSSQIRQSIRLGKMQIVSQMLGRPYYVTGTVVKGEGRGKTIGVPTVNLRLSSDIQPAPGVYITSVLVNGLWQPSVSNIGCKPTFQQDNEQKVFTVETHILNFSEDLYGETLRIQFHDRVRDEKRFSGVEELVGQIKKDILLAKKWFESHSL